MADPIRKLEEERDDALEEVHALRREVDSLEDKLTQALDEADEYRGRLLESRSMVVSLINARGHSH